LRVNGKGSKHAEIAFIGERPGKQEFAQRTPMVGQSGQVLHNILKKLGITSIPCWFTNIIHCYCTDPTLDAGRKCLEILKEELLQLPSLRLLVVLGDMPMRVLIPGTQKGVIANSGQIFESVLGIPTLVSINPAAVIRDFKRHALLEAALTRIISPVVVPPSIDRVNISLPESYLSQQELFREKPVALDLETTGLDYLRDEILKCGIYAGDKCLVLSPEVVKPDIISPNVKWVAHNGSFDQKFLRAKTGKWIPIHADTMIMSYLLEETFTQSESTAEGGHGLKRLAALNCNAPTT
jgi:uracil-DNA glycosylase family 4